MFKLRIIHTSDWHIGRFLNGYSLLEDQAYFLNWLVDVLTKENVDVLIVSGDIYNTASPSAACVGLLDEFLCKVVLELKKTVLLIAGNHDSPEKLGFSSKLLEKSGLIISTNLKDIRNVILKTMPFSVGVTLFPFISIAAVKEAFKDRKITSFDVAAELIYENKIKNIAKCDVNILCAHGLFLGENGSLNYCDSELAIGGLDVANLKRFKYFSYVALGHLHGFQRAGVNGFYCGSPLKYSVSEVSHKKRLILLDIKDKDNIKIEHIFVEPKRDLIIKEDNFKNLLNIKTDNFVSVRLTDESFVIDPYSRLKQNMPNILEISYSNINIKGCDNFKVSREKPIDMLFEEFYNAVVGRNMNVLEKDLLKNVLSKVDNDDIT